MEDSACKWLVAINAIHEATERIAGQIEYLKSDGLLRARAAELHKLTAEELRSSVCYSAIMELVGREERMTSRARKKRRALEKKLHAARRSAGS